MAGTVTDSSTIRIGIFGHGAAGVRHVHPSAQVWIESFGACIARSGAVLLTGGAGGVAEFARRGALSEGGVVVSIHPGDGRGAVEDFGGTLGTVIATGQGKLGRVHLLVQSIDLGFSLGGGAGTLVEVLASYMLGVPVVVVQGLGGESTPDPSVLLHDVTNFSFGDITARRGYFDAKDRESVVAPIFCSKGYSPEEVLALGRAYMRGEV
jgi:hypothetical protein